MINEIAAAVPKDLLKEPGAVFQSGPAAFTRGAKVYLLGAAPLGATGSVADNLKTAKAAPQDWSDYTHGTWDGKAPGAAPIQRRVRHILDRLGVSAAQCPSSTLLFTSAKAAAKQRAALTEVCWPVHEKALALIKPRSVICFGAGTADQLLKRLPAHRLVATFTEDNKRGSASRAYRVEGGLLVFALSNPAASNWANPDCDPAPMMRPLLAGLAA